MKRISILTTRCIRSSIQSRDSELLLKLILRSPRSVTDHPLPILSTSSQSPPIPNTSSQSPPSSTNVQPSRDGASNKQNVRSAVGGSIGGAIGAVGAILALFILHHRIKKCRRPKAPIMLSTRTHPSIIVPYLGRPQTSFKTGFNPIRFTVNQTTASIANPRVSSSSVMLPQASNMVEPNLPITNTLLDVSSSQPQRRSIIERRITQIRADIRSLSGQASETVLTTSESGERELGSQTNAQLQQTIRILVRTVHVLEEQLREHIDEPPPVYTPNDHVERF